MPVRILLFFCMCYDCSCFRDREMITDIVVRECELFLMNETI
jgi:hypothetical protein